MDAVTGVKPKLATSFPRYSQVAPTRTLSTGAWPPMDCEPPGSWNCGSRRNRDRIYASSKPSKGNEPPGSTFPGGYWRLRTSQANIEETHIARDDKYLESAKSAKASQLLNEAEVLRVLSRRPQLLPRRESRRIWSPEVAVAIARTPERNLEPMAELATSVNAEQARTLLVIATANSMLGGRVSAYPSKYTSAAHR